MLATFSTRASQPSQPNCASTFSASTSAVRSLLATSTTPTRRELSSSTTWNGAALIQGAQYNVQTVPDPATYGGDFSALLNAAHPRSLQCLTWCRMSVLSRRIAPAASSLPGVVAGGNVPRQRYSFLHDHAQRARLCSMPASFPVRPRTLLAASVPSSAAPTLHTNLKEEIVRIDHNFSDKFSVFGHFIAEQVSQGFPISQWSGDNVPTVGDTFGNPSYSAVVHTTYTISPNAAERSRFQLQRQPHQHRSVRRHRPEQPGASAGYDCDQLARSSPARTISDRIPNIDLKAPTGTQFEISSWPWHNNGAMTTRFATTSSWTKGAHQFKFGFSWALYKKTQDLFGQTQGGFNFDGTLHRQRLRRLPSRRRQAVSGTRCRRTRGKWNNVSWAAYVQDNWRVNRKLTLNLGLRWDGVPHTYEANNRMGNFYPALYNPANAATFDSAAHLQRCHRSRLHGRQPRPRNQPESRFWRAFLST